MKEVIITKQNRDEFLRTLKVLARTLYRDLPWRRQNDWGEYSAYNILVSELMLQQTQVSRVIPKYDVFIKRFPDISSLAAARFDEVLPLWTGLGYNRRARYLHEAAKLLVAHPEPWDEQLLITINGIGKNTAAAICAYSYNKPVVFIETNIRTVLFNHFLFDQSSVSDAKLLELLEELVPLESEKTVGSLQSPRFFYWALMDYGSELKRQGKGMNDRSQHYKKQSTFQGSRRQLRGKILKLLLSGPKPIQQLRQACNDERFDDVVELLSRDKLITLQGKTLMLYNNVRDNK